MPVFADNPAIETAPLTVLVAMAALGFVLARPRSTVLKRVVGPLIHRWPFGRFTEAVAGYSLLIVGLVGTVLWFVDNLS